MMKRIAFILLILISASAFAQDGEDYHTDSRKAKKYFEQALKHMEDYRDDLAVGAAKEATIEDPDFLEAYLLLSDIYKYQNDRENFEIVLREILRLAPSEYYSYYLITAKLAHFRGDYEVALSDVKAYENYDSFEDKSNDIKLIKENVEFAINSISNPVDFEPFNLGSNVNTPFDDYWPSLTADEEVLVYTINIPRSRDTYSPNGEPTHEDLFVSQKDDSGNWSVRNSMGKIFNTPFNEGAQCVSSDGRFCVFTACKREDGYGSCDLYISFRRGRKWLRPFNLGPNVNTKKWESKPSLSADGRYLYFARGIQVENIDYGMDIWCVEIDNGKVIGEAFKLEGELNTEGNEIAPCIHPDGKTMYFSSTGHPGLGGYDIFMSRKQSDGTWGEVMNLGYPINTNGSEIGLIVNASGDLALFASEREGGNGGLDIYGFELYEEARPNVVTYVKGRVYDVETNEPLEADCRLYELLSGELTAQQKSDAQNGKYLVCLPEGHEYAFNVEKQGYMFYSENFSLMNLDADADAYIMDIPLQPIREGQSVILKNIFFEFDSYQLKSSSDAELNKLYQFMVSNPHVSIEISGHTDNVGSAVYNKTLSLNRAKAVLDYLTERGIDSNRLSCQGYGFDQPIADNSTDEGRALNRRTEFKIIKVESSEE